MKVLISAEPSQSHYVAHLAGALGARGVNVECGVGRLFEPDSAVDILHIQWPEALCGWREPSASQVARIGAAIGAWRSLDRPVVITRHNAIPHAHRSTWPRALYDAVLSAADGVVHLGTASLSQTSGLLSCSQVAIPHGNFPEAIAAERFSARVNLGIQAEGFVVLVFGAIRHLEEKRLILETFRRLRVGPKVFVVPRWREATQPSWRHSPLSRIRALLLDRTAKLEMRVDDRLVAAELIVPAEQVGAFFGAADVVFIPRLGTLNSAVIPLAYSHGRVVVGPRTGNLTEILEATKNPGYQPGDPSSAAEAIATASSQDLDALGEANRRFALEYWDWSKIAGQHLDFYAEVLSSR
jgi:glycosyltransferase involved in cell wall biosynthesis